MNTRWIVAIACGAAFALAGCSSNNEAATERDEPPSTLPDTDTDPPPDGNTDAEGDAFDEALASARKTLEEARQDVKDAETAATTAATAEARTAAQTDIADARKALDDAVKAAQALEAPSDDDRRLGLAHLHVNKATEAQEEDLVKLKTAEDRLGIWSAGTTRVQASSQQPLSVVRNWRQTNAAADSPTLLKADDLPAVMYADGKIVIAQGRASSGDRLRMRGIPVSWLEGGSTRRGFIQYPSRYDVDGDDDESNPLRTVAGLKITNAGLVVDIGGKGAFGADFIEELSDTRANVLANTENAYDLTLSFGRPMASPLGSAEYYWEAPLMPTVDQRGDSRVKDGERILPVGTYFVRLSNHLGLNKGTEYADGRSFPDDDTNSYLSYAAYGFFDFASRLPNTVDSYVDRIFPFHVGYDAFSGASGRKVTDVADAEKITEGTFRGRTIASELTLGDRFGLKLPRDSNNSTRLQGDIELTATISGTSSDNAITGAITNLESWDNVNGQWQDFSWITEGVTLSGGTILDSGSFSGTVEAPTTNYNDGEFRGNFYGPISGLEAAGIWYLQTVNTGSIRRPIVGSFGAKHVPAEN